MCDFDEAIAKYQEEREAKRRAFLDKCLSAVDSGEFASELLVLYVCKRFKLPTDYYTPYSAYNIVEYYIDKEVEVPFNEWLSQDNAPIIQKVGSLKKIFKEFSDITDNVYEIASLANEIYGLDIRIEDDGCGRYPEYWYAFEFDFNSYTSINIAHLKELLIELDFCRKYEIGTTVLELGIYNYGLADEQLDQIRKSIGVKV